MRITTQRLPHGGRVAVVVHLGQMT